MKYNTKEYIFYLLGFLYLLINANCGINPYDEGIPFVGGQRILFGDIPYSDFWTIYPPGIYYLSALVQYIFTESLIFFKFINVIVLFFTAFTVNSIFKRISGRKSILPFVTVVILTGFGIQYLNASSIALLFVLLSILKYFDFFDSPDKKSILYTSLWVSLVGLFRHDFAAYLLASQFLILVFAKPSSPINKTKVILYYLLGLIPMLIIYIVIAFHTGIRELIDQLILFPLFDFGASRQLPFPTIWGALESAEGKANLIFKLWQAVIFIFPPVLSLLGYFFNRNKFNGHYIIFLGFAVLIFYNQALTRSDYAHVIPSLILSVPILFSFFDRIRSDYFRGFMVSFILGILLIVPIAKKANNTQKYYMAEGYQYTDLDKLWGVKISDEHAELFEELAQLVKVTVKDEPIYIGLKEHSRIYQNNVLLYYLTDKHPPTKFHELHPGAADTEVVQRRIAQDLHENTKYALLINIEHDEYYEGSKILDKYLKDRYDYVIKNINYELLVKSE